MKRKVAKEEEFVPDQRFDDISGMPNPLPSDGPGGPLQINDQGHWMILSDIHIPYFDKFTMELALEEGKKKNVCGIFLNGDIMDCASLSTHKKYKKAPDYGQVEIPMANELLDHLRKTFPKARILWKNGNHEERMLVYVMQKASELNGIEDIRIEKFLKFKERGIEKVEDRRTVRFGKLNVIHGHELLGGGGVNPARWMFLKTCQVALCGHFHRTSEHFDRNMNDYLNACWSVGCMCDLHPHWNPLNKWNHGFAMVELTGRDGGDFHVHNVRVQKGKGIL